MSTCESEAREILDVALRKWYAEDDKLFELSHPMVDVVHIEDVGHCLLGFAIGDATQLPPEHTNAHPGEELKTIRHHWQFKVTLRICDRPNEHMDLMALRTLAPNSKAVERLYNVKQFDDDGKWLVMPQL